MEKIFNQIKEIAFSTFGDASNVDHLRKGMEEIKDAIDAPDDVFEKCDVVFTIFAALAKEGIPYDEFVYYCQLKADELKKREWRKENGIYKHV